MLGQVQDYSDLEYQVPLPTAPPCRHMAHDMDPSKNDWPHYMKSTHCIQSTHHGAKSLKSAQHQCILQVSFFALCSGHLHGCMTTGHAGPCVGTRLSRHSHHPERPLTCGTMYGNDMLVYRIRHCSISLMASLTPCA